MNTTHRNHRVAAYIVLLIFITLAANALASQFKDSPVVSLIVMSSPALAALIASLLTHRSLKDIGWHLLPVKWMALGWVLPMLYALPAYALVWFTNLGGIPNPTFLERARLTLNMPLGSDGIVIVSAFFYITLVNLIPATIFSLGEEIGWRGFLVPELTKFVGFRNASLLSGVLWAAWHLPGIFAGSYGSTGTPKAYQIACFTAMVITTGVILAWLRMKSGSIWPVAIMHATHNGLIQTFLDRITIDKGNTQYFTGEFGVMLITFAFIIAWYVWNRPPNTNDQQSLKHLNKE